MGREVRKVPADWQHPKYTADDAPRSSAIGRYIPMHDTSFSDAFTQWRDDELPEWLADREKWQAGLVTDHAGGWKPIPEKYQGWTYEEYAGDAERIVAALNAAPPVGGEVVKLEWRDMSTAPQDGSRFIAIERFAGYYGNPRLYEWEGPPNYWNSVGGSTCIRPAYQNDYLWMPLPGSALVPSSPSLLSPRFKIRQLGEIEFEGVDGKPEHINGLVLEALSDDDVRAAGSLFGQTVTVGVSS